MSGIAVLFQRDGRPGDPAVVARVADACARRGGDGTRTASDGPITLVHALGASTPDAERERHPHPQDDGIHVLTWDGRLDNREEVASALGVGARDRYVLDDAGLVLLAYAKWEAGCIERLDGDYAFAIWDRRDRHVFCGRDPLGQRPFYYFLSPSLFVGASSLRAVLEHPSVPRVPNEGMVAEYLAGAITSRQDTLFAGIHRLPPGEWLVVSSANERRGTAMPIEPRAEVRYARDEHYAEHLGTLLRDAVKVRLRDVPQAGCELSGGLDSSVVCGTARQILGADAPHRLTVLSLVFPGLPCDERHAIETCHAAWRLPFDLVDADTASGPDVAADAFHLDFPYHPNGTMSARLRARARARGTRVILTGIGGDEWFTGSRFHYADYFRAGRLDRVVAQMRADAMGNGPVTASPRDVFSFGVWPLVPHGLKRTVRTVRMPRSLRPVWMTESLAARISLDDRLRSEPSSPLFPSHAQRHIWRTALSGWSVHGTEMEDRLAADLGVELRHPLSDLRVVRFALALPESQRWRGRDTKVVLRAAADGLVPDAVRARRDKPDFSPLVVRTLEAHGGKMFFERLGIAQAGWVDAGPLGPMYDRMLAYYGQSDPRYMDPAWALWMICGVERWARAAGSIEQANSPVRVTA